MPLESWKKQRKKAEVKKKKKGFKEMVPENFPNLAKDINLQIQDSEETAKSKNIEIHTKTNNSHLSKN